MVNEKQVAKLLEELKSSSRCNSDYRVDRVDRKYHEVPPMIEVFGQLSMIKEDPDYVDTVDERFECDLVAVLGMIDEEGHYTAKPTIDDNPNRNITKIMKGDTIQLILDITNESVKINADQTKLGNYSKLNFLEAYARHLEEA